LRHVHREGVYFRVCDPDWTDCGDTSHNRRMGGRWNPRGRFGALYLNATREVAAANQRFSNVERIKQFTILGDEWLPDSEELTPTMKLKRRGINAKYAAEIEAMYNTPR